MSYSDSLKGPEKERYERKLQCLYGRSSKEKCVEALDSYHISVELWIDDVSRWPPIEFPHVYTYLIDTPGEFTREKLKAFKSLQAYNYKYSQLSSTVPALEWECLNEENARQQYYALASTQHINFQLQDYILILNILILVLLLMA
eukprot:Em0012g235a